MASRIKGITLEIGGDTTKLQDALKDVNKSINNTQSQLKDVDKLLKLNPNNTELVAQKQRLLGEAIEQTKSKLAKLQEASAQANKELAKGNISQEQYDALQREIVATESELNRLTAEQVEFNDTVEDMGESASRGGEIAKSVLKSVGAVALACAGAVAGMVKGAVESYGEYEQLEGGVKKLFGENMAKEVIANSQEAYRTAGLSANEYMETVTGFSASLINSLKGDTKEATRISDLAIKDMSDNANTFGTDMESIQNAYQGFAKGQFNMLDNLKLGYAGSKEGMKSLLADAEKLTGKKYNIDNLKDIYEAIHEIQVQSNIAGTTEKEAMSTIQGSASATKSAWQNVLSALGGADIDLNKTIDNLIKSVSALITNLLPSIKNALGGVAEAVKSIAPIIIKELPSLVQEILPPLLTAVMGIVTALMEVAPQLIETVVNTILSYTDEIINCAVEIVVVLAGGLGESLPKLIPPMLEAVKTIVNAVINNLPKILEAGAKLIKELGKGILKNIPSIVSTIGSVISAVYNALKGLISKAYNWGSDFISGLVKGIKSKIGEITGAVKGVAQTIWSYLHFSRPEAVSPLHDYENYMPHFIEGMTKGIEDNKYKLIDAVQGMSAEMVVNPQQSGIMGSLGNIQNLLAGGNVIVLDTGELVGATARAYDNELGRIARMGAIR